MGLVPTITGLEKVRPFPWKRDLLRHLSLTPSRKEPRNFTKTLANFMHTYKHTLTNVAPKSPPLGSREKETERISPHSYRPALYLCHSQHPVLPSAKDLILTPAPYLPPLSLGCFCLHASNSLNCSQQTIIIVVFLVLYY